MDPLTVLLGLAGVAASWVAAMTVRRRLLGRPALEEQGRWERWARQAQPLGLQVSPKGVVGPWRGREWWVAPTREVVRIRTALPHGVRIRPEDHDDPRSHVIEATNDAVASVCSTPALDRLRALPDGCWVGAGRGHLVLHVGPQAVEPATLEQALARCAAVAAGIEAAAARDVGELLLAEPDRACALRLVAALDLGRESHRAAARHAIGRKDPEIRLAAAERLRDMPSLLELAFDPAVAENLQLKAAWLLAPADRAKLVRRLFAEGTAIGRLRGVKHAARAPSAEVGEAVVELLRSGAVDLWTLAPTDTSDSELVEALAKVLVESAAEGATEQLVPLLRAVFEGRVQRMAYRHLMRQPDSPQLLGALRRVRPSTRGKIHGGVGERLAATMTKDGPGALSVVEPGRQGGLSIPE